MKKDAHGHAGIHSRWSKTQRGVELFTPFLLAKCHWIEADE